MDDFKGTLVKITKGVGKTSGDFLKTAKLSLGLSSEEENLKKIYVEIGKKVHEIYLYGGSLGKVFDEKYREILETEAKIRELRDRLNAVKGAQTCPKCGKTIDRAAAFCPKCGFRIREDGGGPESAPAGGPQPLRPDLDGSARPPEARPGAGAGFDRPAAGTPGGINSSDFRPAEGRPAVVRPAGARGAEAGSADTRPADTGSAGQNPAAVRCAVCGAEAEPGAKFCLGCGRILR